LVLVRNNKAV